jgi:transcriptional regulator with XRE-family HTH domain
MNIYQKSFFNGRLLLKYSFRKFASELGITHTLLYRIENGTQMPSQKLVKKLVTITGYELLELVSGDFSQAPSSPTNTPIAEKLLKIKEMNLSKLTPQQRDYLREKWSVENKKLSNLFANAQSKFNKRMGKTDLIKSEVLAQEDELSHAKSILTHLKKTGASDAFIAKQQALITNNETRLAEKKLKSGYLSIEEAILEQVNLDELAWKKQYLETKIVEIDAIA